MEDTTKTEGVRAFRIRMLDCDEIILDDVIDYIVLLDFQESTS